MRTKLYATAILAVSLFAFPVCAQSVDPPAAKPMESGMMDHSGHAMGAMPAMGADPDDPVAAALAAINRRMHRDMDIPSTGNADRDFVVAMIPHHRGAVDMARLVIGFGSDPEIRKLAEAIIAAQEAEIAMMQAWLAKQPQ